MLKPLWVHHKGEKMWVPDGKIFWNSIKRMAEGDRTILPLFRTTMTEEQALDRIFEAERRAGGVQPEIEQIDERFTLKDPVKELEEVFG